jgi:hypothetical protein
VHVIVWRYQVEPDRRPAFERAYGPGGPWTLLFAHSAGYLGTELVRLTDRDMYITIDRWESESAFERCKTDWQTEYDALDRELDPLTAREEMLGAGEVLGPAHPLIL